MQRDGTRIALIIRRLFCERCDCIHHELPDIIVPYKRHASKSIEAILKSGGSAEEDVFPGEANTIRRLRIWFALLREYFESCLEALKELHLRDLPLCTEIAALVPLKPDSLPAGWLARLVRILVNSGRWRQTRSA